MIGFQSSGSFKNTDSFLQRCIAGDIYDPVAAIAEEGVQMLRDATPEASGLTANSWAYEIVEEGGKYTVWFTNSNNNDGFNVAVGLQYGHGTGTGGWIGGIDYINPALKPIFDKLGDAVWKEVAR